IAITGATYDSVAHQVVLSYNNINGAIAAGLTADRYTLFVRGDQIHDTDDGLPLASAKQLIVGNAGAQTVSVVDVPGDGTLQAQTNYQSGSQNPKPAAVVLADVTGDGVADLVAANSITNSIDIFQGLGNGTFTTSPSQSLALPSGASMPTALAVA